MNYKEKIESNPDIMLGKPVIKGTRITVELILKQLSEGATKEQLIKSYPIISEDDISACLDYAYKVIAYEEMVKVSK